MNSISSFRGEYRFLSNFYPVKIYYQGKNYCSVEHAYQAQKELDPIYQDLFTIDAKTVIDSVQAKRFGKTCHLRRDWEFRKLSIMYDLVTEKFTKHALRIKLLQTKPMDLVEVNWWNDRFWGVCKGEGENWLGKILMNVRSYYDFC